MTDSLEALADFILARQAAIVDEWGRVSDDDDYNHIVRKLSRDEFRNNIGAALDGFCKALRSPDSRAAVVTARDEIEKHGQHRWKQGFQLDQLIRDWGHLNQALTSTIAEFFEHNAAAPWPLRALAYTRLAEFMTIATSSSVSRFDELKQAEAASVARDLAMANEEFQQLVDLGQARSTRLREAIHDLRGSLSVITWSTETLRTRDTESAEVVDLLARAVVTVGDMLSGIHDLSRLDSGGEPVAIGAVDVAALFRQLGDEFQPQAARKGLELTLAGPAPLIVQTDAGKVRRIGQHLLINAIRYTRDGAIALRWERAGPRWYLRIEDTGPGIQEHAGSAVARELDRPDESTDNRYRTGSAAYPGEGIGLTIVKRLCEALDAGLDLQSQPGRGTRVEIDFPIDVRAPAGD